MDTQSVIVGLRWMGAQFFVPPGGLILAKPQGVLRR